MTELEEYPDEEDLSECCGEPMYSQMDICPKCGEHA